ncbi:MAG: 4a-hydroxytetrahydrobiopterin dehydratase [Pseudomonadota bacterium]
MAAQKISNDEIEANVAKLDGWTLSDSQDAISKKFKFDDFVQAFSFMSAAALKAEKMDHHPEWFNVYNRVEVKLTTHDVSGLSDLDMALAHAMDELAA